MKLRERISVTRRGYRMLKTYCPGLIAAKTASACAEALTPFIAIWASAQVVGELTGSRNAGRLVILVLAAVALGFAFSMIRNALDRVIRLKESGMWNDFQKIFSDKQMRMDYASLEDQAIQKQRQKAMEDLFMFGNGLGQLIWDTPSAVRVLVGITASAAMSASLFTSKTGNAVMDSRVWLIVIPGILILSGLISARLRKKEDRIFEKWTDSTVWYNRSFMFYGHALYTETARAKDVRLYRQDRAADREMQALEEHNRKDDKALDSMSACQGLGELSKGTASALCSLFAAAKAGLGAFPVGYIVQYTGALTQLVRSIGELFFVLSENRIYTEHLAKLFAYLDTPDARLQGKLPIDGKVDEGEYTIEFRNVSFRYPGSRDFVLKNVTATLRSGKKQALVGANGAGKTTFVKLLCRLYEPTEGQILLKGIDIREYDREEYLKLFSFVFQDFSLFALSLGENIAAGRDYDTARAEECIRKAALSERYRAMPDGLGTILYRDISEKGIEISGGEAQKIALARALYKGSPVIVLDEPTAALDPIAEQQVYAGFDGMVKDKTAIYISHRLSSCRFCDEITVFDAGRIVQKGTHEELMKEKDGKYLELWNAQAQYYVT